LDSVQQNIAVEGWWDDPPSRWAFEQRWEDDENRDDCPRPVPILPLFDPRRLPRLEQRLIPAPSPVNVPRPSTPNAIPANLIDRIMAPAFQFIIPLYLIDPWGLYRGEPDYMI